MMDFVAFVRLWLEDLCSRSGGDLEALDDRLFRVGADDSIDECAVFEDQHSGYARDLITRCCLHVLVDVQFSYSILPLRLSGELVHDGCDRTAWRTPRRPAINQHRLPSRLQHLAFKSLICNNCRFRISAGSSVQLFSTPAALRLAQSAFIDPVFRSALAANNYSHKTPPCGF